MKPQAARERFDVRQEGETVVLVDRKAGNEVVLDPIAGAVWLRADGTLDVRELAAVTARDLDALVGEPEVWAALDALGDAGLLQGRAAPPADTSMSRRFLLRTAAVAGTIFVGTAGAALAADDKGKAAAAPAAARKDDDEVGRWRVAAEQAQKGEQSAKTQESQAKGSYESVQKGEQGSKAQENAAKTSAESSEKTSLDSIRELRVSEEQSIKLRQRDAVLEQQLAAVRAQEEEAKASIAAEANRKSSAQEQDGKASSEHQGKVAAEASAKAAAEQGAKSTLPGAGGGA